MREKLEINRGNMREGIEINWNIISGMALLAWDSDIRVHSIYRMFPEEILDDEAKEMLRQLIEHIYFSRRAPAGDNAQ